jgi:hypothetical protein
MEMRDGSPSIVRRSWPQLQAACRVVMGRLPGCRYGRSVGRTAKRCTMGSGIATAFPPCASNYLSVGAGEKGASITEHARVGCRVRNRREFISLLGEARPGACPPHGGIKIHLIRPNFQCSF